MDAPGPLLSLPIVFSWVQKRESSEVLGLILPIFPRIFPGQSSPFYVHHFVSYCTCLIVPFGNLAATAHVLILLAIPPSPIHPVEQCGCGLFPWGDCVSISS